MKVMRLKPVRKSLLPNGPKTLLGSNEIQLARPRLKGKFYRVVATPTLLYALEYWLVKYSHVQKIKVADMRMRE